MRENFRNCEQRGARLSAGCKINSGFTGDYSRMSADRRLRLRRRTDVPREDALHLQLARGH
jgi:hypothetical protein